MVIEEGCQITSALLCDRVVVRKGAVVERGCLLDFDVVVGADRTIPELTVLSVLGAPVGAGDRHVAASA